jgi:hypothetical protein
LFDEGVFVGELIEETWIGGHSEIGVGSRKQMIAKKLIRKK